MIPLLFALLQDAEPPPPLPPPTQPAPTQPTQPQPAPIAPPPSDPVFIRPPTPAEPVPEPAPQMSEGRMLVSAYNQGFQLGFSPGLVFVDGEARFALGARFGYGFDLDTVIVVPGARVSALFLDPNIYVGMPTVRLILPIDRFAPFVEGGGGIGHISDPATTGFAWLVGGGFMIHFRHFAFGAEVNYQAITSTAFSGIGVGPILAFGF